MRTFSLIKKTFLLTLVLLVFSCKIQQKKSNITKTPFFELSLAQWSLHKAIGDKSMSPIDFAKEAKEMGFKGLEYVSGLYNNYLKKNKNNERAFQNLLDTLKVKSEKYGLKNLLIMVDGEGELAHASKEERNKAIENHKKWVDAAAFLGCHSIRLNLFGSDNNINDWKKYAVESLTKLSVYAKSKNINIIVENHGGFSSNASFLVDVMRKVNLDNCGTLPDFGNFCIKREDGKRWGGSCIEEYDKYKGVQELMPFAKGVSAKSYDFDEQGNETTIDFRKMLKIIKDSGYTGFIDVEYEGSRLSEEEGIKATQALLIKIRKELN